MGKLKDESIKKGELNGVSRHECQSERDVATLGGN